ncbi:MAG: TonB-dependent receptor, partial [Bacteroidota bacterium]|nr:TonB-dependent receptor [Bacteroidota bacterium]
NTRNRKNLTGQFFYSDWAKNSAFVPAPWEATNDYNGIDRAGTDIQGSVFDQISTENVINNDIQGQLAKNFGSFTNRLILGYNVYQRKTKQTNVGSGSIVVPDIYNVSNRRGELTGGESNTTERKYGYYADLTTGFKDFLFLHGSFRYDATSKFFKPTRATNLYSYPYYGVDAALILTDAIPAIKNNILSYAKLRAGFNRNGNDNLGTDVIYGLDLSYPNGAGFPYGNTVGLTVGDLTPDANLKPEFVTSYEGGGEFQFFKGRINLEATYYTQTSKGQVIDVKIPVSTGFPQLRINVGETKNWGYETDLRIQVLKRAKYSWEVSARYSYNDNKVISLYPGVSQFSYGGYSYASTNVITGLSFPQLQALPYTRDDQGRVVVNKTTGYPLRNSTLQNFGRTIPKHILGWGTRFNYSNFSLAANFEYRGGNNIFHQLGRDMTFTGSGGWTADRTPHVFPNSSYDDGTGKFVANTDVNVREAEYGLWVDQYRFITENFVTPGWFIKFRDVNISYNIPASILKRTKVFSAATIAIYGRNLFTIVDKSNYYTDPEFSYTTGNGVGINNTAQTPPVRQYGVNLNIGF